jgi:hypothetical protein
MAERRFPTDDPIAEAIGTTGLFLLVTAVVAFVVAIAGFGAGSPEIAIAAAAVTVLSFVSSMGCFSLDSKKFADDEVVAQPATSVAQA